MNRRDAYLRSIYPYMPKLGGGWGPVEKRMGSVFGNHGSRDSEYDVVLTIWPVAVRRIGGDTELLLGLEIIGGYTLRSFSVGVNPTLRRTIGKR